MPMFDKFDRLSASRSLQGTDEHDSRLAPNGDGAQRATTGQGKHKAKPVVIQNISPPNVHRTNDELEQKYVTSKSEDRKLKDENFQLEPKRH